MEIIVNSALLGRLSTHYRYFDYRDVSDATLEDNKKIKDLHISTISKLIDKCPTSTTLISADKCFKKILNDMRTDIEDFSGNFNSIGSNSVIAERLTDEETINKLFTFSVVELHKKVNSLTKKPTVVEVLKILDMIQSSLRILQGFSNGLKGDQAKIDSIFGNDHKNLVPFILHVICNNPDIDFNILEKLKLNEIEDYKKFKAICDKKTCNMSIISGDRVNCQGYGELSNYATIELPGELDLGSDAAKYECCDIGIIGQLKYNLGMSL